MPVISRLPRSKKHYDTFLVRNNNCHLATRPSKSRGNQHTNGCAQEKRLTGRRVPSRSIDYKFWPGKCLDSRWLLNVVKELIFVRWRMILESISVAGPIYPH